MIALAGLLILVAGALLVGGLGNGETTMLWGSVGVSALAAGALVLNSVRRTRAARARSADAETPSPAAVPTAAPEPATATVPEPPAAPTKTGPAEAAAEPAAREPALVPTPTPEPEPAVVRAPEPEPVAPPVVAGPSTGSHAPRAGATLGGDGEPVEEDVEVTDLLMILDLTDEVVVVDEHPRYHLAGCSQTAGEEEFPLPLSEARQDGFTACGICRPDRHLADTERQRRAAAKA